MKNNKKEELSFFKQTIGLIAIILAIIGLYFFIGNLIGSFERKVLMQGIEAKGVVTFVRDNISDKSRLLCIKYCDINDKFKCHESCFGYINVKDISIGDTMIVKYLPEYFKEPILVN